MRSTLAEYGLTVIAVMLIVGVLSYFGSLLLDGGSIKEALMDYINTIC